MSELLTNQNFDSTHIILLYGQDNFGINEELKKIKNSLGKFGISPDDITTLDGLENDLSFLLMNVWQAPMLAEKQVIIVRRFENMVKGIKSTNKKLKEHLENYINNPTKSTLLILVIEDKTEGKADFNKKIFPYDSIIKLHISKEFPKIYPNKFSKWLIDRFASNKVKIDWQTAELIVSQSQQNLMDIANEVDKILIAFPDSKTISFDEIRNFIGFTRNNTPFDLTNFVAARNSKKAFSILHNLLKTPYQEVIIIAILRDLFIKILKLIELKAENSSDEKIATSIGVHRFYLNDYMIALSKYSVNEVENALIILCNTDKAIKSSNASNKLIMHEMLLNIVG